ncbi:NUDIX hydrolase [Candidatus Omnitrophus magneticus]|uniref:GDP-mannose pyrophosphatase n=1 Tax=Candidatus Omnitrophus magneticus TaxID=1609969 RepID=A0A0F0CPD5_9BACT|nr:NUDIX hydrolase [Candidatus Omnitrophus magneticus]
MSSNKIFDGKLIKLYQSDIDLPNGRKGYFEHIKHPGTSLVVPFFKGKIVFIRQYRAVLGRYIWELPAGTLNPGESNYVCAKREVTEETGYKVSELRYLGEICTAPGFCNEIIKIYRALCVEKSVNNLDADECIKVKLFTKSEIVKKFKNRKILDAKTISALAMAGVL